MKYWNQFSPPEFSKSLPLPRPVLPYVIASLTYVLQQRCLLGMGWSPDYCYTSSSSTPECHTDTRRQVVPGVMPRTEAKVSKAPQLVSMPQHVWLKCLAVHHNNKMWHFSEAVKLQSKKWSWLGTAPEDRRRAFNLLVMGKMEEDKIPIQPFLQGPKWSHCNPTGYLRYGRKFFKTNILEYNHTNSIDAPNSLAHWKLRPQCLLVRSRRHKNSPMVGTKKQKQTSKHPYFRIVLIYWWAICLSVFISNFIMKNSALCKSGKTICND